MSKTASSISLTRPSRAVKKPSDVDQWVAKRNADDSAEKTKRVSLDIPADIHRKLKLQAMDEGKTMITLVREILAEKFA
ncbi:hypothetical protein [Zymomonas mobilis]|uniref:hypothetical protein n=1 Tax=Zymomonas mobilis TaxID=542 RepID=UPI0021C39610|nr:hypothetical protein [Zymomonas mobilis]MCP9308692.1 hypothetical protein [Zymomonas mobilis]